MSTFVWLTKMVFGVPGGSCLIFGMWSPPRVQPQELQIATAVRWFPHGSPVLMHCRGIRYDQMLDNTRRNSISV